MFDKYSKDVLKDIFFKDKEPNIYLLEDKDEDIYVLCIKFCKKQDVEQVESIINKRECFNGSYCDLLFKILKRIKNSFK